MPPLSRSCPAKVNLFLEVLARRDDGFHEISTVLAPVNLSDDLAVSRTESGVTVAVEGAELPPGEGNLVFAAASAFLRRFAASAGLAFDLTKRIPLAAGLGGGSSDAAGTLLLLRDLLRPETGMGELGALAAEVGSDVAYFLEGGVARAGGRGERVERIGRCPEGFAALFLPPFGCATKAVYHQVKVPDAGRVREPGALLEALGAGAGWTDLSPHLFNRLEEAAVRAEPRLGAIRGRLEDALAPGEALLLAGSGSSFFVPVTRRSRAQEITSEWNRAGAGRALMAGLGFSRADGDPEAGD